MVACERNAEGSKRWLIERVTLCEERDVYQDSNLSTKEEHLVSRVEKVT